VRVLPSFHCTPGETGRRAGPAACRVSPTAETPGTSSGRPIHTAATGALNLPVSSCGKASFRRPLAEKSSSSGHAKPIPPGRTRISRTNHVASSSAANRPPAGNERGEIDGGLRAVGPGDGDGMIGMRSRVGNPGPHGSILDPSWRLAGAGRCPAYRCAGRPAVSDRTVTQANAPTGRGKTDPRDEQHAAAPPHSPPRPPSSRARCAGPTEFAAAHRCP
jgi:hypothetical protein